MNTFWTETLPSTPLGPISITVSQTGVIRLLYGVASSTAERQKPPEFLSIATSQVLEYLSGRRKVFSIPIDWSCLKPFAEKTLRRVAAIPFGMTASYAEIARAIGNPGAFRAVGGANASNPIPIIIPCHRVIGSNHSLQGYNGPHGVETKAWLLRLEGLSIVNQRLA